MGSIMVTAAAHAAYHETGQLQDPPKRDKGLRRANHAVVPAAFSQPPGSQQNQQQPQQPQLQQRNRISSGPAPITTIAQQDQTSNMPPSPRSSRPVSSGSSAPSMASWDSFATRGPASNRTSLTSVDPREVGPRRPEFVQKPPRLKRRTRDQGELFASLPNEVLALILHHLREMHLDPFSTSCATCMMRDLCSVALASHRWLKFARTALYEDIQLNGAESPFVKKRYRMNHGTRLVLLRRTLRSNPNVAALVRSLKPPVTPDMPLEKYQNMVASVIMACPNFERLHGFHQRYDHSFNRLFYALSTREHLKEMSWLLDAPSPRASIKRSRSLSNPSGPLGITTGALVELEPEQSDNFIELHHNWSELTTLSVHCLPGATLTPITLLGDTMANMPSLRHLHLSNLPDTAFNDMNLLGLPALDSLSLSHIDGITSSGLELFTERPSSHSIRRLTLCHVKVDSLQVLGRIFSNLTSLETFSFVQETVPTLPEGEMIFMFPYVFSKTLRHLHWDITSNTHEANEADSIVSRSISANGFPALRTLRTPNDPDGLFQALCRPNRQIELPGDKHAAIAANHKQSENKNTHQHQPPDNAPPTPTTPRTPTLLKSFSFKFPDPDDLPEPPQAGNNVHPPLPTPHHKKLRKGTHLAQARLAAQARIEDARDKPRCIVKVFNEDGKLADRFGIGGHIGETLSQLEYRLSPDSLSADETGGLTTVADTLFAPDGGEVLDPDGDETGGGGCIGQWNACSVFGQFTERKEKERWWHTERGSWVGGKVS